MKKREQVGEREVESDVGQGGQLYYGIHTLQELLERQAGAIEEVWLLEGAKGRLAQLAKRCRKQGVMVRYRPRHFFDRLLPSRSHQGAIARMRSFSYAAEEALIIHAADAVDLPGPLLFLVGVQDPGNVGALIRSGLAFGASGVLLSRRDSCGVTPAVVKASAGAAALLPVAQVHQVQQTIKRLREAGWWLIGLHPGEGSIDQFDLRRPTVFVLGAEGKGLKPSIQKHCDVLLGIPMVPGWNSLNVSVCGGVALYEWRRQNLD